MNLRFADVVDVENLRGLLEAFYQATGILHGLVDEDNNVISSSGWQQACSDFHHVHPCTKGRCLESSRSLAEHIGSAQYVGHQCCNGLFDYAAAIIVEGRKLATLYFGQVLHEPPDLDFFTAQARECGFDEEAYLAAIRKVPVVSRERVTSIMTFYGRLAQTLARSGLDRLRQREAEDRLTQANCDLGVRVEERTRDLAAKNAELLREIDERRQVEAALRSSQERLHAVMDSSPVAIGWAKASGEMEHVNPRFVELTGYHLSDVPSVVRLFELVCPDEGYRNGVVLPQLRASDSLSSREAWANLAELELVRKDGAIRRVVVGLSWAGEQRFWVLLDVTDRWRADRRERARNDSLELIAKDAPMAHTLGSIIAGVHAENGAMLCSILLRDRDGAEVRIGAAHMGLEGVGHHPDCAVRAGGAGSSPGPCWSERILSPDGREFGTFAVCHRQTQALGEPEQAIIRRAIQLASIAIEHHRAREELEHQARTDFLTGTANRRELIGIAKRELAMGLRYDRPLSVLMIDIDHFKAVNDNHGHDAGDAVLQTVARVLRGSVRSVDAIGRIGGEEFAAVLPESTEIGASELAERLRLAVERAETPMHGRGPLRVTVSIGVATLTDAATDVDALLARADRALYAAKNGGRNRVCCATAIERLLGAPPGNSPRAAA